MSLPLLGIVPNSLTEKAGLQRGDSIISVNGVAISSMDEYVEAKNLDEDKMIIIALRADKIIEATLDFKNQTATSKIKGSSLN